MFVIIAGGGTTGAFVAKQLLASGHEITVIDRSQSVVEESGRSIGGRWVWGDACDPVTCSDTEMNRADAVLALAGEDEDNLVISQLAKQEFGVETVLARINEPENGWLFDSMWGVDVAISAPAIISQVVEEEVTVGDLISLLKLAKGNLALVEITIPEDSPASRVPVSQLTLPPQTNIIAIVRADGVRLPSADLVLETGDEVLAITSIDQEEELHRLLGSPSRP